MRHYYSHCVFVCGKRRVVSIFIFLSFFILFTSPFPSSSHLKSLYQFHVGSRTTNSFYVTIFVFSCFFYDFFLGKRNTWLLTHQTILHHHLTILFTNSTWRIYVTVPLFSLDSCKKQESDNWNGFIKFSQSCPLSIHKFQIVAIQVLPLPAIVSL